jgi:nucleoside-diphosphate-sugar epimerase
MRTLIIGGTEFIGPHIVERLLKRGHEVTVLHRRAHHELGPNVRNLQADRGDLGAIARLLSQERPEAVFDLAYDWGKGTPAPHVLASARNSGDRLQRYVFMSSVAAYGPGVDRRESDPLASDDIPNPYAQHKATSERALFRMHEKSGFPVTSFRPPFVHGPRQPFYREQFFWDRLLDGRPIILPDGGHSPMQWVYVEDLAEACARAIEVPDAAGEAFNIAHTEQTSQRTFIEALARTVDVEPRFVEVPREKIHDAGGDIFKGNLYFGEYLDLPPHTTIVEKAPRVLGVTPTPLERALAAGFAWHRTRPRRPADYAFEDRLLAMA